MKYFALTPHDSIQIHHAPHLRSGAIRGAPRTLACCPARPSGWRHSWRRSSICGSPDEAFRRRIGRQLNRGEATNDLRRFIFFVNRGAVRYPHHDDQTTQAYCHTLVVNACVLATTGYLQDAVDAQRAAGRQVSDEAIAHLSPAHFETINPYGTLTFDIAGVLKRSRRPPSRL